MFRTKAIALFEGTFGESGGRTKCVIISHITFALRFLSACGLCSRFVN